jgi:hypothetical protein
MSEPEAFRTCPHCGLQEVPILIVSSAPIYGKGSDWQCRSYKAGGQMPNTTYYKCRSSRQSRSLR